MTTRSEALANAADLLGRAKTRSYGSTANDLEQGRNLTAQAEAWLDLARQLGDEAQTRRNLAGFGPPQPAFGGPVVCQNTLSMDPSTGQVSDRSSGSDLDELAALASNLGLTEPQDEH